MERNIKPDSGKFIKRGTKEWWNVIGKLLRTLAGPAVEEEETRIKQEKKKGRLSSDGR